MLSRPQIQFVNSLQQKKYRKEHQCFVAEGSKLVEELLQSRLEFHTLYATREWLTEHQALVDAGRMRSVAVSENELSRISTLKTTNQALAIMRTPSFTFDPKVASGQFVLMLDRISDPGNLGTILRTADWFGIHDIVCSLDTVDIFNPKTVQATMGSIARVNICYLDLKATLSSLEPETPVYGAMLDGQAITDVETTAKGAIIIGSEAHGISQDLISFISHPVLIPSFLSGGPGLQRPESLNAAVAAAILCWELRRKTLFR